MGLQNSMKSIEDKLNISLRRVEPRQDFVQRLQRRLTEAPDVLMEEKGDASIVLPLMLAVLGLIFLTLLLRYLFRMRRSKVS